MQPAARTVSLSLTPTELSRLSLALRFGKVSVSIRNPGDDRLEDVPAATLGDIAAIPGPAATGPPPRPHDIPFYSGTRSASVRGSAVP